MSEVRCVLRANYKTPHMGFCDLGRFEIWLPETEAYRLMNDRAGRERLFFLHFPTATEIAGEVSFEVHEKR